MDLSRVLGTLAELDDVGLGANESDSQAPRANAAEILG